MSSSFTTGGLELDIKGFKDYIRRLDEINAKQKETFEREFKGSGKSFEQVERAAKSYENQLKSLEKEYNRIVEQEKRLAAERQKQATQFLDQQRQRADAQKAIAIAAAGVVAREVIQFGKESVDLAREQARAEAQLATAIQSTGGAAQLGSNQLRLLAGELQGITNFGDEATIAAEALLLTFTNIKGTTFERAVRSIQDVSTAMDQDLGQTTIQVGKALNAPVEGLSALRRVGIQFTDAQEALITKMVEANNVAGAQAIILDELERQFGGSAEAAREADAGITALGNSFGDFKEQIGFLLLDLNKASGLTANLASGIDILTGSVRGVRFDLGLSDDVVDKIAGIDAQIANLTQARDDLANVEGPITQQGIGGFLNLIGLGGLRESEIDRLNEKIAGLEEQRKQLDLQATAEDAEELAQAQENAAAATEENTEANKELQKALEGAVRQAEQLAINFTRAQEGAERKAARQTAKLARDQEKAREKLLIKQQKQLDDFEEDRIDRLADFEEDRAKQIAKTEKDIAKEEARAQRDRQREQENFHRQLRQAEDRFNLDRVQSQRRFTLEETRLRAEGDILGLQRLREDFALSEQEASENFDLQQRQAKENEQTKSRDQEDEQEDRLAELKQHLDEQRIELEESLEKQRADLLIGFDEQLADLQESQLEQRQSLAESLAEQEEDRRISQQRQLEDLGRSLAAQKDLTAAGAAEIAQQLEEAFGIEGVADQIMSGFTMRQESAFQNLFESIANSAKTAKEQLEELDVPVREFGRPLIQTGGGRRLPGFQEGGSFTVGGAGGADSQLVAFRATPGERVTVTPQQFRMPIAAPSQVNVSFGGRSQIDVSGLEGASQATVDRAVEQMIELNQLALQRILRRYGIN